MRGTTSLRNMVLGLALGLTLTSCKECKREYSGINTVKAVVVDMYHSDSYATPIMIGKTITLMHHPAVNKVTFGGDVNFEIDSPELYDRFKEHDTAIISYRNVYRAIYDDKDKDGVKELVSREFRHYDFVDAVKK
jgi:hypothetical protein